MPAYDAPVSKGNHSNGHHPMHPHGRGKSSSSQSSNVVEVNLMVKSGGKCSDPHKFFYTINGGGNGGSGGGLSFSGLLETTSNSSAVAAAISDVSMSAADVVSTYGGGKCTQRVFSGQRANRGGSFPLVY